MRLSMTRLWIFGLAIAPALHAQFSSGSTGSDGALNLTTPGTTVFDPVAMGLNPAGDNIFNFTTINDRAGHDRGDDGRPGAQSLRDLAGLRKRHRRWNPKPFGCQRGAGERV
jgi:hypothetical protein